MELAPASDVYEVLDAALKTTDVRPGLLRVEREYGTLEVHGFFQENVKVAGREALAKFGLTRGRSLEAGGGLGQDGHRRRSVGSAAGEPGEPRRPAARRARRCA